MPWHHDGWYMGWMWIWWALVAAGLALAVFFLVSQRRAGPPGEPPERVVKRRYARGEIDRETYRQMLDDLQR